jgi:multidrug transporter EmrE-like cation transporter
MLYISYILASIMAAIDIGMMSLLKMNAAGRWGVWVLPVAMALYSLQPIFFRLGLVDQTMGLFNVLWNVLSTLTVCLIGYVAFEEKMSVTNLIGVIFSVLGIVLIGM